MVLLIAVVKGLNHPMSLNTTMHSTSKIYFRGMHNKTLILARLIFFKVMSQTESYLLIACLEFVELVSYNLN